MDFIILAAGKGVRVDSHESNLPKVLLQAKNGKPLLINLLDRINACSYDKKVNIVVGFLHEKIINEIELYCKNCNTAKINIIYNKNYEQGVITSLYQGIKNLNGEIVILNGDTLYSPNILKNLEYIDKSTLLVMPDNKAPDSVKVSIEDNRILMVGKNLQLYSYVSTGCLFLDNHLTKKTVQILEEIISKDSFTRMIWHNIINLLIDSGEMIAFKVMESNSIFEIDTKSDYKKFLEKYFNNECN